MTKQQLREAIRRVIKQELNEGMKTKIVPNPNAGKWRIVGIESGSPLTNEFYNSKEEAQAVGRKLRTKESGIKYIQLKDTMSVYTNENAPAPSKPSPTREPAVAPGKPAEKKPRRPLGNPNVKPQPKATMKEAEMLKQVIKRFKSKK
jgi:hypothetical protein